MQAYKEEGGIVPIHLQPAISSRCVVSTYSGRFTPRKDLIPIVQEGWWTGQSGWQAKYCPPTGLSPWTVQLGATHYNDYAIQLPGNLL